MKHQEKEAYTKRKELATATINKMYPLQLWITTLAIALVIMSVISYVQSGEITFLFVVFMFSIPFSLPVLAVNFLLFKILSQKFLPSLLIKLLLNVISIIGIIITFLIISGSMADYLTFIYLGAIILASLFFRIYKKETISN